MSDENWLSGLQNTKDKKVGAKVPIDFDGESIVYDNTNTIQIPDLKPKVNNIVKTKVEGIKTIKKSNNKSLF